MTHELPGSLKDKLEKARELVEVGAKYFHFKHPEQFYKVLSVGLTEENQKVCVIYEAEYEDKLVWIRPINSFLAKVRLPDGTEVDRFTKVI